MISKKSKDVLEKQGYRLVGNHSAVKTCSWTKNLLRGEGGCYKLQFYGIKSHKCLQMTTSFSCANRCTFCWRDYKAPVSKEWEWDVDDSLMILESSIEAHHSLLNGFKGNKKVSKELYEQSRRVEHVALSLTGEPILYPKINELIDFFHKNKISTFLVTNAQYPNAIRDLRKVTQLYVSLDAPNRELLKEIDKPLFSDFWERLLLSLDYLKKKEGRTCIRLTCVKGVNMCDIEGYKKLIERGEPDFIEIKGYMFVGASRERLTFENMPSSEEIRGFGQEIADVLEDYELIDEHDASRVVLLAHKKYKNEASGKWDTWIDFNKFFEENK